MKRLHQSANENQASAPGVIFDKHGPLYKASAFTWEKKTGFVEGASIGIRWSDAYPEFLRVKSDKTDKIKKFIYHGSVVSMSRRLEFIHYRNSTSDLSLVILRSIANMVPPKRSDEYARYL